MTSIFYRLIFLLVVVNLTACQRASVLKISGETMGTFYYVSWNQKPFTVSPEQLNRAVFERLRAINASMSTYQSDSELSRINQQITSRWTPISHDMYQVVSLAKQIKAKSMGALEIRLGSLVNLWGFGSTEVLKNRLPDPELIERTLTDIQSGSIELRRYDGYQMKLSLGSYIDLSSIAKGFAVDELATLLVSMGINDFLIDIGGELKAQGRKPDGSIWTVAIEVPEVHLGQSVQKIVKLDHMGIATSGDYRNYFEYENLRYSHTLDPRTGYPITHGLASVTVVNSSVAVADGWATALNVLGVDDGLLLAERYQLAVLFLLRDQDKFVEVSSSHFKRIIER